MAGLRGQHTEWSGVDGAWYSLIADDQDDSQVRINVRLTAPLPSEFPDRQLVTGLAVISDGHSLVVEVKDPYSVATAGCLDETTPCLADGALRVTSDGSEDTDLLHPMDGAVIQSGAMVLSASNLPIECTKFGGDKIWAEIFAEMQATSQRHLEDTQNFGDWVIRSKSLAAPEWCAKFIAERGLAEVQSKFATFKIQTSSVTVRLNVGVNYQGGGETDWDGRVLPDLEFWQMDVGLANLHIGDALTGILGETSRPILDEEGVEIMEGPSVIRGAVEDYRLSGPLDLKSISVSSAQNIVGGAW